MNPAPHLPTLRDRRSGLLLHPTSLPGPNASGDLGEGARHFVDFLEEAGQSWWQTLPVVPPGQGFSPYSSPSAFAGSPYLIDLDALVAKGWLTAADARDAGGSTEDQLDVARTLAHRDRALRAAFHGFERRASAEERAALAAFVRAEAGWLDDYGLYTVIKTQCDGRPFPEWPAPLRDRDGAALAAVRRDAAAELAFVGFTQYLFVTQWRALRTYANDRGVGLIGDIPIFVDADSADVWANRDIFDLKADGRPRVVAGVPPDAFSATGQRWGNALYKWDVLAARGFDWWLARLRQALSLFDAVRIDHFIAFYRYWEIQETEPTAIHGQFLPGPREPFFEAVSAALGLDRLIAEDLGIVTEDVVRLRERFDIPGMRVMQFSFYPDASAEPFRPHTFPKRSVAYTGTHDNETSVGWRDSLSSHEAGRHELAFMLRYIQSDGTTFPWDFIAAAMHTASDTCIVPVQDILSLGNTARMNRPGEAAGNWTWRMRDGALTPELAERLRHLTQVTQRDR